MHLQVLSGILLAFAAIAVAQNSIESIGDDFTIPAQNGTSEEITTSGPVRPRPTTERATTYKTIPITEPVKPVPENRRCHCYLRASNTRTSWTFMKEDLESVLDSDSVEGHIVIPFAQRPEMCSDVASECAAHCKSVGARYFGQGHESFLKDRRDPLSVGDYVCSVLKWGKKNVKVEVTSEADCGGLPGSYRSVRRQAAFVLVDRMCCKKSVDSWVGSLCSLDVIG